MDLKTEPIYYLDPYQTDLSTTVTDIKTDAQGKWLCTDQTLFYPGGGGQLPDQGTLNNLIVENVQRDGQKIWHKASIFKGEIGDTVQLKLDWSRRFYMMQQHSGQHLISHVLNNHGLKTVSVHLGEAHTLIETEGGIPSKEILGQIELEANALIQNHLQVHIHFADKKELSKYPLRRPAGDRQTIRIVEIDQIEFAACGGTHVANTAEIGLIKFAEVQRIRGHARLSFYIGQAAYNYLGLLHDQIKTLKQILQGEVHQIADRAVAIQADLEQQSRQTEHYRRSFLNQLGQSLTETDESFIFKRLDDISAEDVSYLTRTLANDYHKTAFLITGSRFYFIRAQNMMIDLNGFLKTHARTLEMRGGGSGEFIQGILELRDDSLLLKILFDFLGEQGGG